MSIEKQLFNTLLNIIKHYIALIFLIQSSIL